MAAHVEAQAAAGGGCAKEQELLGAALVAALELALLAAHRLLGELDSGAGRHAEAAAHLARALALAESDAAPRERALAPLALGGPRPVSGGPAAAHPRPSAGGARASGRAAVPAAVPGGLSRREAEGLGLLAAGRSTGQIAQALCLSPRTVQRHVANLYLKIGAHSRAEATAYALRHGLA